MLFHLSEKKGPAYLKKRNVGCENIKTFQIFFLVPEKLPNKNFLRSFYLVFIKTLFEVILFNFVEQ